MSGPDVLGHFDLLTKFSMVEETEAYRRSPKRPFWRVLPAVKVVEVNTGAMARGLRASPYPADFLLKAVREAGGSVILSSDAHRVSYLDLLSKRPSPVCAAWDSGRCWSGGRKDSCRYPLGENRKFRSPPQPRRAPALAPQRKSAYDRGEVNGVNFFGHLKTVTKHRFLVMAGCFRVGLILQGLTHDLSKFSPTEFLPGRPLLPGQPQPKCQRTGAFRVFQGMDAPQGPQQTSLRVLD